MGKTSALPCVPLSHYTETPMHMCAHRYVDVQTLSLASTDRILASGDYFAIRKRIKRAATHLSVRRAFIEMADVLRHAAPFGKMPLSGISIRVAVAAVKLLRKGEAEGGIFDGMNIRAHKYKVCNIALGRALLQETRHGPTMPRT